MKKQHNISTVIMLIAGAAAVLCGMLKGAPILTILKALLVVLIVFLIVGRIVETIICRMNAQVEEADRIAEEEARRKAMEEEVGEQEEAEEAEEAEDANENASQEPSDNR